MIDIFRNMNRADWIDFAGTFACMIVLFAAVTFFVIITEAPGP